MKNKTFNYMDIDLVHIVVKYNEYEHDDILAYKNGKLIGCYMGIRKDEIFIKTGYSYIEKYPEYLEPIQIAAKYLVIDKRENDKEEF